MPKMAKRSGVLVNAVTDHQQYYIIRAGIHEGGMRDLAARADDGQRDDGLVTHYASAKRRRRCLEAIGTKREDQSPIPPPK